MKKRTAGYAAAWLAATAMTIAPLAAKKAESLRDLLGASGASAETQIGQRGFEYISGKKDNNSSYTYWWHRDGKDCVVVEVSNGRVVTINDAKAADCGKKSGGSDAAIAAAAIGAVAIGALLMSGKEKDKHREQYNQDWQPVEVYNTQSGSARIFRKPNKDARVIDDVREGTRLRNYGCERNNGEIWCEVSTMNGRTQGWARDRYLRVSSYGGGGSGGSGSGSYDYLAGARPARAEDVMRNGGFRLVDSFKSGRTSYSIWYSERSRECLQMAVANDRVDSVVDIRTHPRCR